MIYCSIQPLLNAGSKAMNVNGSVTPKVFTYTAGGSVAVTEITCLLKDEGNTAFASFGAISALSNGLLLEVTQGGSTRTISTIKDNADMCVTFSTNQFGNGAVLSILSIVSPEGFGDTNNCFMGILKFQRPITLESGDTITLTVRDNLTGIDVLQMSCGVCAD